MLNFGKFLKAEIRILNKSIDRFTVKPIALSTGLGVSKWCKETYGVMPLARQSANKRW